MTNRASVSRQSVDQLLRDSAQCLTALPVQISQNPQPGRARSTQKGCFSSTQQYRFYPIGRGNGSGRPRPAADHRHITGIMYSKLFSFLDTFSCIAFQICAGENSVLLWQKTASGYQRIYSGCTGEFWRSAEAAAMSGGSRRMFIIARYGEAARQISWRLVAALPVPRRLAGRS